MPGTVGALSKVRARTNVSSRGRDGAFQPATLLVRKRLQLPAGSRGPRCRKFAPLDQSRQRLGSSREEWATPILPSCFAADSFTVSRKCAGSFSVPKISNIPTSAPRRNPSATSGAPAACSAARRFCGAGQRATFDAGPSVEESNALRRRQGIHRDVEVAL